MASIFMGATMLIDLLTGWVVVLIYTMLYGLVIGAILTWSRRAGWGQMQVLALAGGALLTYAWHAFPQWPVIGSTGQVDLAGNVVFALGAVILLAAAIAAQRSDGMKAPA